jgi:hypothetical protein
MLQWSCEFHASEKAIWIIMICEVELLERCFTCTQTKYFAQIIVKSNPKVTFIHQERQSRIHSWEFFTLREVCGSRRRTRQCNKWHQIYNFHSQMIFNEKIFFPEKCFFSLSGFRDFDFYFFIQKIFGSFPLRQETNGLKYLLMASRESKSR